jgi:DNA-binding transcriptional regulator YiaG
MTNTIDALLDLPALLESGRARQLRENAGLSSPEMARQLDVSPAAVTRWEQGVRRPLGANARKYARLLSRLAAREAAS